MSTSAILIIIGAVVFVVGLVKLRASQTGGFNLSNFGITIGGTTTQNNKVGNVAPGEAKKPDWVGLAIAALGLLTAIVGWLKG